MNKLIAGKTSVLVLTAVFAVSAFLLGKSIVPSYAGDKVEVCHCASVGNCDTIEVAEEALSGHFDANGNPLHAGDHLGQCTEPTSLQVQLHQLALQLLQLPQPPQQQPRPHLQMRLQLLQLQLLTETYV